MNNFYWFHMPHTKSCGRNAKAFPILSPSYNNNTFRFIWTHFFVQENDSYRKFWFLKPFQTRKSGKLRATLGEWKFMQSSKWLSFASVATTIRRLIANRIIYSALQTFPYYNSLFPHGIQHITNCLFLIHRRLIAPELSGRVWWL